MKKLLKINQMLHIFTIFFAVAFMSCEHKYLDCLDSKSTKLKVVFDWKNAPDARPTTMRLYMFPTKGGKALKYEFTNYKGGVINIPTGEYKALCVNSDTESVLYRNINTYEDFEAYLADTKLIVGEYSAPRVHRANIERIAKSPDQLYSAHLVKIAINLSVEGETMTLYPESVVCRYKVSITNVSNLKYVTSDNITAALSGMSEGVKLGQLKLTSEHVTIPFGVVSDGVSSITANFLTLGKSKRSGKSELTIYFVMNDGNKYYYTFDVTRQIDEAVDARNVHIVVDGLQLPKPIVNGGGFHPSINEWQGTEVELPM